MIVRPLGRRDRPYLTLMITAACIIAQAPSTGHAQQLYVESPIPVMIRRPSIDFDFSSEISENSQRNLDNFAENRKTRHWVAFDIKTSGFLYHPALLDFDLTLNPEMSQISRDQGFSSSDSKTSRFGYNVATVWLKQKPYALNLNASKARVESSNDLQAFTVSDASSVSAQMRFADFWLPTDVRYEEAEIDSSGYFDWQEQRDTFRINAQRKFERNRLIVNFEETDRVRTRSSSITAGKRRMARSRYTHSFAGGSSFTSSANRMRFSSLDREFSSSYGSATLALVHALGFKSRWQADYNDIENQQNYSQGTNLAGTISHQLYENLSTQITMGKSGYDTQLGAIETNTKMLGISYNRRIPWGHLNIGYSEQLREENDQRSGRSGQILNEAHQFEETSTIVFLDYPAVEVDSIRISDDTGTIFYEQGIDYQVELIGNLVAISRNPLADIPDNATILVSYSYTPEDPSLSEMTTKTFRTSVTLGKWLTLHYTRNRIGDLLLSGPPRQFSRDNLARSYGAVISVGKSRTNILFREVLAERLSYDEESLNHSWSYRPATNISLTVGGYLRKTKFVTEDRWRSGRGLQLSAGLSTRNGRHLSIGGSLGQTEGSSLDVDSRVINIAYRWRFGAWNPSLSFRYHKTVSGIDVFERDGKRLLFEVHRAFL